MKHIMLDLETLGTGNNAAIVAIGACQFDLPGILINSNTFYSPVDCDSAMEHGVVTGSTIKWWMQQSDAARASTFANDAPPLGDALYRFSWWVEKFGGEKDIAVWGNASTFDNVIIRSGFASVGLPVPWSFRGDKCYRTVINLLPEDKRPPFNRPVVAHNALDDAVAQATYLQACYQALGLNG
jgi:DNA polymerase III epsilon subunit-like protein